MLGARQRRQRLSDPLRARKGYEALFRLHQPVSPIYFSRPGEPPSLGHRTAFDDLPVADRLRAKRALVKGRFLGGGIGYVLAGDVGLYANAFARPLARPSAVQREVLAAVRSAGPLTPRQAVEETGLLSKQLMPAMHRLQSAFLVYEDQVDREWDRAWYDFESEWPDVELRDELRDASVAEVLRRFLRSHVFATEEQMRDWSRLPLRTLRARLADLERDRSVVPLEAGDLGVGWALAEDVPIDGPPPEPGVLMLQRHDPLVRSHASELERRFGELEVLQYLLVDGVLVGAVLGHWRFRPYDVEDIVVELPARRREEIRDEAVRAVSEVYHPPRHHILRYAGKPLR